MKTKSEKREEKSRKRRSHKVSGKSVIKLARLIEEKGRRNSLLKGTFHKLVKGAL